MGSCCSAGVSDESKPAGRKRESLTQYGVDVPSSIFEPAPPEAPILHLNLEIPSGKIVSYKAAAGEAVWILKLKLYESPAEHQIPADQIRTPCSIRVMFAEGEIPDLETYAAHGVCDGATLQIGLDTPIQVSFVRSIGEEYLKLWPRETLRCALARSGVTADGQKFTIDGVEAELQLDATVMENSGAGLLDGVTLATFEAAAGYFVNLNDFFGPGRREYLQIHRSDDGRWQGTKIVGDANVPRGKISFRTNPDCPVLVTKAVPAQLQVRSNVSDPNGFEWDLMDSTLVYDADEDQWHLEYHGRTGSFKRVDEAEATNAALSPDHR